MPHIIKNVAKAIITSPSAVQARCSAEGMPYHNGAIWVEIPELGFFDPNLIYCRYALALPYLRIQENWKVLVEPTVSGNERWFYTGIVDCGATTPKDLDQMVLQFESQLIYASTQGIITISSETASEPFVLGNKLLTWITDYINNKFNLHTHVVSGVTAGSASVTSAVPVPIGTVPTDILSTKIMGE